MRQRQNPSETTFETSLDMLLKEDEENTRNWIEFLREDMGRFASLCLELKRNNKILTGIRIG